MKIYKKNDLLLNVDKQTKYHIKLCTFCAYTERT